MTMLRRARPALYVAGGLLLVGSLLGASLLATGTGTDQPKTTNPTNGKGGSGPVVIGFVDSNPSPVPYGLPPVMQSGMVAEVLVKEGQHVDAGAPLFRFDTTMPEADLKTAEEAVKVAQADVKAAETKKTELEIQVEAQQVAVDAAQTKADLALRTLDVYKTQYRETYKTNYQPDELERRLQAEPRTLEYESAHKSAVLAKKAEEAKLSALKKTDAEVLVKKAEAGVGQARALEAKARSAVEMCTVKAKSAGVVEQINVSAGTVLGISTRITPLWLIPDGPRVVRAEVEAEFAHRVTPEMYGRQVTIHDHNDPKLTYKGTFKRISDTFLTKRSGGENVFANETKVLEAVVEINEPLPAGQPPLRVGQKVKVNFGP
jgi:multidrug resistance efflux pump